MARPKLLHLHGVCCADSLHVTAIDLQNANLDSDNFIISVNSKLVSTCKSISTAFNGTIFSLTNLSYLDLSFNNFMCSNILTSFVLPISQD
ncbi:hypothetical protein Pint_11471 [Pistacia integerrima]|uniref:Uncharacterized protein n=1 Tax=Pistacia integerrima TaxID=434235 RepID=A0ACC0XLA6_9ROSI|nr:hypothetical protein Pint_11471 [Pistacia integerrima]